MKYNVGMCIFFNWNNPYAKIIRLFNKLNYGDWGFSHIGIITEVKKDKVLVYEALYKGFTDISWSGEKNYYSKKGLEKLILNGQARIGTPKIKLENVKEEADKYLGLKYAPTDIINIITGSLFNYRFFSTTPQKIQCGEVVARILYDSSKKRLNVSSEYCKYFDEITPMDLFLSDYIKIK